MTHYDMYATSQLAWAMPKPSTVHMVAAKHVQRYLSGTTDFSITYKKGDFKLPSAFLDANGATRSTTTSQCRRIS